MAGPSFFSVEATRQVSVARNVFEGYTMVFYNCYEKRLFNAIGNFLENVLPHGLTECSIAFFKVISSRCNIAYEEE